MFNNAFKEHVFQIHLQLSAERKHKLREQGNERERN